MNNNRSFRRVITSCRQCCLWWHIVNGSGTSVKRALHVVQGAEQVQHVERVGALCMGQCCAVLMWIATINTINVEVPTCMCNVNTTRSFCFVSRPTSIICAIQVLSLYPSSFRCLDPCGYVPSPPPRPITYGACLHLYRGKGPAFPPPIESGIQCVF